MKSTARKGKGATQARGATSGEPVRTTFPVALTWFYFWALSPLGWPADFVFLDIVTGSFGDPDASMRPRWIGLAMAVVPAWLLWRTISRSTSPLTDGSGLRVRSWFRAFNVPWDAIVDVAWMEPGSGRNLRFSHTIVRFEAYRLRRVVVSMSWRSGSAGAMRILSWAPPGHRLRQGLPREWRELTADQIAEQVYLNPSWDEVDESAYDSYNPHEATDLGIDRTPQNTAEIEYQSADLPSLDELAGLSTSAPISADSVIPTSENDRYAAVVEAPVNETLRPSLAGRRRLALGMGAVTLVCVVGGLSMSADRTALGWGFATFLWSLGLIPIYSAVRAFGLRIELSDAGMVVYGLLITSVYPRAEIADIVVTDTGAGPMARLILAGRGSRALSAAGTGRSADPEMMRRLGQWLDETTHLDPD